MIYFTHDDCNPKENVEQMIELEFVTLCYVYFDSNYEEHIDRNMTPDFVLLARISVVQ